jgi:hypothetical protein
MHSGYGKCIQKYLVKDLNGKEGKLNGQNARKNTKNLSEQTFDDLRAYHYFIIILYFRTYGKNTVHLL